MKALAVVLLFAASAALAAEQTAFGIAAEPSKATRTIAIDMSDDMRFAPAALDVKVGETVRFVVANKGAAMHELVLGTAKDIARHAQAMAKTPDGMARHDHQLPSMVHVHPGSSGEIVWRFNRAGTFAYACLVPGHYEAGMKGTVVVK